jgi:single-stranded DNA-binding protein
MNGFSKTSVLGRVTNVADGVTKQGKAWFRANVVVREWTGRKETPYESVYYNVVAFDRIAEKMKEQLVKGMALYAEGRAKVGKAFKNNKGEEITPLDLVVRDWSAAGVVPEFEAKPVVEETEDESDPFAN